VILRLPLERRNSVRFENLKTQGQNNSLSINNECPPLNQLISQNDYVSSRNFRGRNNGFSLTKINV